VKSALWAMLYNPVYQGDVVLSRAWYRTPGLQLLADSFERGWMLNQS
jgi:hypothetical protein